MTIIEAEQSLPHEPLRVLIVDDDPMSVQSTSGIIEQAGYEVITAADGEEGMRKLNDVGASIVISDFTMPKLNGLEFCQAVRGNESVGFVYFMMLTGSKNKDFLTQAFDAGADDFLTKPYDPGELLGRLRAATRIVTLERESAKRLSDNNKVAVELAILNEKLRKVATIDELTGLANRRVGMEKLAEQWRIARRYGMPLSCIMLDADRFKSVNDTYGHAAGDTVLKCLAKTLSHSVRTCDTVIRHGGEEFLILAPNTSVEDARGLAERVRACVEDRTIHHDTVELRITISLGLADSSGPFEDPEQLLHAADEALYDAKASGRNRYVVSSHHREECAMDAADQAAVAS